MFDLRGKNTKKVGQSIYYEDVGALRRPKLYILCIRTLLWRSAVPKNPSKGQLYRKRLLTSYMENYESLGLLRKRRNNP